MNTKDEMKQWQCRIAPSLGGGFAGTPAQVWGTNDYVDPNEPTVFFGCYGLPDFFAVHQHKGRKAILWAGSDIRHFVNGYWLDQKGKIRIPPKQLARWLSKHCEHYVENAAEYHALKEVGIKAHVAPSFLGNIDDFPVTYKHLRRPKLYASVSGEDYGLYRWPYIEELARRYPDIEFHLYGNRRRYPAMTPNLIVHGRVTQEQMNSEISQMTGGLRLLPMEGCSEIIVKSALWGQWPVSAIPYPGVLSLKEIGTLKDKIKPNLKARNYFISKLNLYPWNYKKYEEIHDFQVN